MSDTAPSAVTEETAEALQSAVVAQPTKAIKQASAADPSAETAKTDSKKNEKKWGKAAMAAGYTIIPDVLLKAQHALEHRPV